MKNGCLLCPRLCGVDREGNARGFCGMGASARVVRAALHPFEEPPISGTRGSGTVFFAGCSLRCVFCQNRAIQSPDVGRALSAAELGALFLRLQAAGAHNINLVTPTHFADRVAEALAAVKGQLSIPVVYNCGGYERVETLKMLQGLVNIYLPDFKYISPELSREYSAAPDYATHATAALVEMVRQVGGVRVDSEGILRRGVIVRHLVLPGSRADSIAVLERIAKTVPVSDIYLSLMRQYTPEFAPPDAPRALLRRVTSFEYESVMERAVALGFTGFFQGKESATADYTPDFSERNLLDELFE